MRLICIAVSTKYILKGTVLHKAQLKKQFHASQTALNAVHFWLDDDIA